MPEQPDITRAKLMEVDFDKDTGSQRADETHPSQNGGSQSSDGDDHTGHVLTVQFNPQTLKVTYKNQKANSDQPDGQGSQYVGRGTTQLSVDLLFDSTRVKGEVKDVREMTRRVRYFMEPKKQTKNASDDGRNGSSDSSGENKEVFVQRGVRFQWGRFALEGVMDSLNETLEFFDEDGHPLRATVSIGITQQAIRLDEDGGSSGRDWSPLRIPSEGGAEGRGRSEAEQSSASEEESRSSVQQLAGEVGRQSQWKEIARANGVENPRAIRNPNALDLNP